jgi:hypothetical protein
MAIFKRFRPVLERACHCKLKEFPNVEQFLLLLLPNTLDKIWNGLFRFAKKNCNFNVRVSDLRHWILFVNI